MDSIPDHTVEFAESRKNQESYPSNLVRKQAFIHTLEKYQQCLQHKHMFHEFERSLYFLDLVSVNGANQELKFKNTKPETSETLAAYLEKTSDPSWRFIFLQSPSSRSPLGCTREQLTMLLTYHQVMPSFSDLIMAFKPRSRPVTHTMFRDESYLLKDSPKFVVPGLGRSGIQIQSAFSVLSVERTNAPNEMNPWPLRQTALYHSFDVVSGQTLFIVLKADINMLKRINKEALKNPEMQPESLSVAWKSFSASLLIQLIIIEWCAENWPDYIEYFEQKVREKSTERTMAPISAATSPTAIEMNVSRRSATTSPAVTRMSTFTKPNMALNPNPGSAINQPTQLNTAIPEILGAGQGHEPASPDAVMPPPRRQTSSLRLSVTKLIASVSSSQPKDPKVEDIEMGRRDSQEINGPRFDIEENLSFEEFQRMNRWSEELEQSLTAIGQNLEVLALIKDQYHDIMESHGFKEHITAKKASDSIMAFFKRIDKVMRDLRVYHGRLKTVVHALETDKALYGAALQYNSAKVSEHFAYTARESADKMEEWTEQMHTIAIKTKQETVSMHVITVFTLIFLPGTFIAVRYGWPYLRHVTTAGLTQMQTFFSSGAIQWNDDGTLGTDYVARPGGMWLFFVTIIPLTVVVMVIWGLVYRLAGRHKEAGKEKTLP